MKFIKHLFVLACVTLVGCGERLAPNSANTASLHGSISLVAPLKDTEVCIYPFDASPSGAFEPVCTRSDDSGMWHFSAVPVFGHVRLEAKLSGMLHPLAAVVAHINTREASQPLAIDPITHLVAGYATYLQATGADSPSAIAQGQTSIHQHFGAIDYAIAQPCNTAFQDQDPAHESTFWPMLVTSALNHLAQGYAKQSGLPDYDCLSLKLLLDALYEDVHADGIFDGIGFSQNPLLIFGVQLSDDTLRRRLSDSMMRLLGSPSDQTDLSLLDSRSLIHQILHHDSPVFPLTGAGPSAVDPRLLGCQLTRQDGKASSFRYPQRGLLRVRCAWDTVGALQTANIEATDPAVADAVSDQAIHEDTLVATIDVDRMRRSSKGTGSELSRFQLVLTARDQTGRDIQTFEHLMAYPTPFEMKETEVQRWIGEYDTMLVSGIANRPVRRASASVIMDGVVRTSSVEYTEENSTNQFILKHAGTCQFSHTQIIVEDWSGEKDIYDRPSPCGGTRPSIIKQTMRVDHDGGAQVFDSNSESWPTRFQRSRTLLADTPLYGDQVAFEFRFRVDPEVMSPGHSSQNNIVVYYRYQRLSPDTTPPKILILQPTSDGDYVFRILYRDLLTSNMMSTRMMSKLENPWDSVMAAVSTHRLIFETQNIEQKEPIQNYVYPFSFELTP